MNFLQPVQNRQHDFRGLRLGQAAALGGQIFGQIDSLQVIHHQIGGAVLLKEAADAHHVGMVEPGQRPGFVQELLEAEPEQIGVLARMRHHRGMVGVPPRIVARQVFLDRHRSGQIDIPTQIGNPKATGFSQHFAHNELSVQYDPVGQHQRRSAFGLVVPALGANILISLIRKTARTQSIPLGHYLHAPWLTKKQLIFPSALPWSDPS